MREVQIDITKKAKNKKNIYIELGGGVVSQLGVV